MNLRGNICTLNSALQSHWTWMPVDKMLNVRWSSECSKHTLIISLPLESLHIDLFSINDIQLLAPSLDAEPTLPRCVIFH